MQDSALMSVAQLAEEQDVELLTLMIEVESMYVYEREIHAMLDTIADVYKGRISISAPVHWCLRRRVDFSECVGSFWNWQYSDGRRLEIGIEIWPELVLSSSHDARLSEMTTRLRQMYVPVVEALQAMYPENRVRISEAGVHNFDGVASEMWFSLGAGSTVDDQEQVDFLVSMLHLAAANRLEMTLYGIIPGPASDAEVGSWFLNGTLGLRAVQAFIK